MKDTKIEAYISFEALTPAANASDEKQEQLALEYAKLDAAVDACKKGERFGPCNVEVTIGTTSEKSEKECFWLKGTGIEIDASDLANPDKVNARLTRDAEKPTSIVDVFNGDGVRLFYNGLFRDLFKVKKGRVSAEQSQIEGMSAVLWYGTVDAADCQRLFAAGKQPEIVRRWKEAGKPQPAAKK